MDLSRRNVLLGLVGFGAARFITPSPAAAGRLLGVSTLNLTNVSAALKHWYGEHRYENLAYADNPFLKLVERIERGEDGRVVL